VELDKRFYTVDAKAALNRALELDSNFAMAYFLMSRLGEGGASRRKALQKAWELKGKVTEKERLQIEAAYASVIDRNSPKAAEILEQLLQKYPHEQGSYLQLAIIYATLGDYEKSIQIYLRGLKSDSLDKNLWNRLAYGYAGLNLRQEALEAVDHYLRLAPGEPNPYDSKGEIYSVFGEIDSAMYWYEKALTFRPDFSSREKLGFNALLKQDYVSAQRYLQQHYDSATDTLAKAFIETDFFLIPAHAGQLKQARKQMLEYLSSHQARKLQSVVADYDILSLLAYELGDYASMLENAQKFSLELKKDPYELIYGRYVLAWAYLKNGNSKIADKLMSELKKEVIGKPPTWQIRYDYTAGLLAYEEGRYDLALENFKKALQPLFPNRAPQFHYAVTLLKTGHTAEAMDELQRVTWWSPLWPGGPFNFSYLPAARNWPIASVKAHYWLGVAYQQTGQKDKAIAEYRKFLEIWKDADAGIPEVEDAIKRLAELEKRA